jgi:hypothetical protein
VLRQDGVAVRAFSRQAFRSINPDRQLEQTLLLSSKEFFVPAYATVDVIFKIQLTSKSGSIMFVVVPNKIVPLVSVVVPVGITLLQ